LQVILYGCEIWSLTLMEHNLKVFENKIPWEIFASKRNEVSGQLKILHSK